MKQETTQSSKFVIPTDDNISYVVFRKDDSTPLCDSDRYWMRAALNTGDTDIFGAVKAIQKTIREYKTFVEPDKPVDVTFELHAAYEGDKPGVYFKERELRYSKGKFSFPNFVKSENIGKKTGS
ncbi:MAG: hypothetical protein NTW30_01795 [Candidatus Aenigmarchaeota archaeon]|nr:hypothetical protein [Candidatus Aenigmarchaeota archaeon]